MYSYYKVTIRRLKVYFIKYSLSVSYYVDLSDKYSLPFILFCSGCIFFNMAAIFCTVCSFVKPVFLLLNFCNKSFVVIGLRARYRRTDSSVIALPLSPGVGVFEVDPACELGAGETRAFLAEGLSLIEINPVLVGSDAGRFLPLPAEMSI